MFTRLCKLINCVRELMGKEKQSFIFLESILILNLAEPALTSIHFRKKKKLPVCGERFSQILIHTLCSKVCNISMGTSFPSGSCEDCKKWLCFSELSKIHWITCLVLVKENKVLRDHDFCKRGWQFYQVQFSVNLKLWFVWLFSLKLPFSLVHSITSKFCSDCSFSPCDR